MKIWIFRSFDSAACEVVKEKRKRLVEGSVFYDFLLLHLPNLNKVRVQVVASWAAKYDFWLHSLSLRGDEEECF